MPVQEIIVNLLRGAAGLLGQLALIFITVMIIVEVLKHYQILEKITGLLTPLTKLAGIHPEGNLPLLAGLLLGIGYGGAIIIDSAKAGKLGPADIYLINLFLVICHSLVEDTLIWLAIGARAIPVQIARLVLAVMICWLVSKGIKSGSSAFSARH